jgi:DNA polymerase-1
VAIVSHDKDLGQLVRPGVSLVQPGPKGALTHLGRNEIAEKFGVPPELMRDYLALVGDTVDNIPGVPGVGAKTAAALLTRFGSLDGILQRLAEVERPAIREALANSASLVRRNCSLVALRRDLPPAWTGLDSLRRRKPDWQTLLAMAREFGFQSLTADLQRRFDEARSPSLF